MSQPTRDELKKASLQDIPLSAVEEQFQDVRGRSSPVCDVEYGTRADDGALIFHFFPPGYGENDNADWPNWHQFRDRLETAILACFAAGSFQADYEPMLRSFWLIINPRPNVPDLNAYVHRFFAALEAESKTSPETTR